MCWTACSGTRLAALAAVALAACGGSDRPAADTTAAQPAVERPRHVSTDDADDSDGLEVEGLQGHLDPAQVDASVHPQLRELDRCYRAELRNAKFLGGQITLHFTVGPTGEVSQVAIPESDLGAWPVEKCLLAIARAIRFPRPKGGNRTAVFTVPLNFASGRGRVTPWEPERIQHELEDRKNRAALEQCKLEAPPPHGVTVTIYVGNRGEVRSVGFASSGEEPIADAWGDCAAAAIAGWKMPDPRGVIAKTAFALDDG
jgi:outer membrane biosynthesis protein TonB